jgi:hypothetical protein
MLLYPYFMEDGSVVSVVLYSLNVYIAVAYWSCSNIYPYAYEYFYISTSEY